ncbi:MAG: glycosyltransferase family 4 protein [Actinomycetia bacterium]|nr:glycosyltransferase family 4 protein [Actinomycetes bacterium]MCH9738639.1 glycosyltransferase family 4 protein [Actinomycetes bacterium]MCH9831548.1 glycosyltransferase family 4 protein [Actinomycetes bacterium]MCH9840769.1 glycosyltransferase family 4 protein [Actinomycetes bacterium]
MKKIGLVCPYSWDVPGGVRSHVADLALTLQIKGYEVSVLAPVEDPDALPDYVVDGGRPTAVSYNGAVARMSFGVRATRRVRQWIREGEFDVVHIHEPLAPSASLLTCWAARGPLVATWHSSHERSRVLSAGYYVAQTAMEKLRGRIAVSEAARETLVRHIGGDAVLIPNGVRVADFRDQESFSLEGTQKILFLGRIDEPRKGLAVLLEALPHVFAELGRCEVIVAGPGDPEEFNELIDPDWRDRVRFVGSISDEEKRRTLRQVDLYVAPHTGGESFGIVLAEAMAAGTAVIASDLPAFERVLQSGKAGRLFPVGDSNTLGREIVELLTHPQQRQELVEAGNIRVMDFDWDRVVEDVIAVYEAVHLPGEKVEEDLRGQVVGRLAGRLSRETQEQQ